MRKVDHHSSKIKVQAIAGTYVVFLGFHLDKSECSGLMGFSIHRTDHTGKTAGYLYGMKAFAETDPGFPAGQPYSTEKHPVQGFQWADYDAIPGHSYTYVISALKGSPKDLTIFDTVSVDLKTERPEDGNHDIYFNRGTAASQDYARRFGNQKPNKVINNQAYVWLSRGLYEAMCDFVNNCDPAIHSLRIAAYEFRYPVFLKVLKAALDRGLDIKVIYDSRGEPGATKNKKAVKLAGLEGVCKGRTQDKSYISHNKFMVKLQGETALEVWTGGTNFSEGGIFGHSNVGHAVQDPAIAAKYYEYWKLLYDDPKLEVVQAACELISPDLSGALSNGTQVIFSPREEITMLDYYALLVSQAKDALFMTFAFGMNDRFKEVYETGTMPLRFALMENLIVNMQDDTPAKRAKKDAEILRMNKLRWQKENVLAIGNMIRTNAFDGWLIEKLTSFNVNVEYVHNKFSLIDPLGPDPIVIAGSANFSVNSTTKNDENMLVIRGNTRVADIYFGEFWRMFKHHSFRESLGSNWTPGWKPKPLLLDNWWTRHFGETSDAARRRYFAKVDA